MPKRPATSMIEEEFGDPQPVTEPPEPGQPAGAKAEPAPTDTPQRKRSQKPQE